MRLGRACPPKLCRRRRAAVHGVLAMEAWTRTWTCRCRTGVVCVHDRTCKVAKSPDRVLQCQQPAEASFFPKVPSLDQSLGGIGRWSFFGSGAAHGERFQVHHAPRQSAHLLGHGGKALVDWPHLSKHRRHWSPGSKWASPAFGRRQSALAGEMRIKVGGR